MTLHSHSRDLLRFNLEQIRDGRKPALISIGELAIEQLAAINSFRVEQKLSPIVAEVVFIGRHIYQSRILRDGYTIGDVIDQISSALESIARVLIFRGMTALENPLPRPDRYGNWVRDRAILECSARHPRAELFGVVPKGDVNKPRETKGGGL